MERSKKSDEVRVDELYKLALETLPVETRRDLLEELHRIIATLPDPQDIETLSRTVRAVKATLD